MRAQLEQRHAKGPRAALVITKANLMDTPALKRPDVVFITVDQWRGDLAPGGAGWIPTPRLDALCDEATRFRNHYTQAYPCGPARAGLLTGLYAHKHRSIRNGTPLDARHRTIFDAARAKGYAPVLFGYTDTTPDPRRLSAMDPARLNYAGAASGLDIGCLLDEAARPWIAHLLRRGYQIADPTAGRYGVFAQRPFGAPTVFAAEDSETTFLTDQVLGHLATQGPEPFFLHISYISPHPPFAAPSEWLDQVAHDDIPPPRVGPSDGPKHPLGDYLHENTKLSDFVPELQGRTDQASADVIHTIRHAYAALAAEVDHHIGRIMDQLKAMKRWDNTIFILSGDHGEMLFEQGLLGKLGWYADSAHVPLIIKTPDGLKGQTIDAFTQSIDIFATLVEALDLTEDVNLDGESLMPFLRGSRPDDWRDQAHWSHDFRSFAAGAPVLGLPQGLRNLHVIRTENLHYVHSAGMAPLLFDLREDPDCRINRAHDPAATALRIEGLERLLNLRLRHEVEELSSIEATEGGLLGGRERSRRSLYQPQ